MTFAAADPDGVRSFPPPAPDELSSPGPSSWAPPLPPPTVAAAIERASHVAEREAGGAFELIWPTGEVDDHIIDGPLPEEPTHGAHPSDATPSDATRPSDPVSSVEPITVVLRPVAPPTEVAEPSSTAPVADDVVLAVRRAIAALESESAEAEESAPPRRLPGPTSGSDVAASGNPAPSATPGDPSTRRSPSEPTDERRSALKRLISGLRRH